MPEHQKSKQQTEPARQDCKQLQGVIGTHVLHALGQPDNLYRVEVRHLWGDHHRVNVLVGGDAAAVKVAHSYFLVTDSDGNIVASTPKIARQY
jgi:hypothetical protein